MNKPFNCLVFRTLFVLRILQFCWC